MTSRYDPTNREAGEGTYVDARRANPPRRAEPVEIVQADGMVLSGDGKYHPLQEAEPGVVGAADMKLREKMDEVILLLRALVLGLEEQTSGNADYFKEVGLKHP